MYNFDDGDGEFSHFFESSLTKSSDKAPLVKYVVHNHGALKPILIGGYSVFFGAHRDISQTTFESMDLICPLNGNAPKARFGIVQQVMSCELQDYGGVPTNWAEFIKHIVELIKQDKAILGYCTGGHGRTGTFGASLISVMEPNIKDPIAAFRLRHCKKAVETERQAIAVFALRGEKLPEKYVEEFSKPKHTVVYTGGGYQGNGYQGNGQTPKVNAGNSQFKPYVHGNSTGAALTKGVPKGYKVWDYKLQVWVYPEAPEPVVIHTVSTFAKKVGTEFADACAASGKLPESSQPLLKAITETDVQTVLNSKVATN